MTSQKLSFVNKVENFSCAQTPHNDNKKKFKNHGLILAISEYINEDSEILKILNLNVPEHL